MGRRKLEPIQRIALPKNISCLCCNEKYDNSVYYDTVSPLYRATGKIPYCEDCLKKIFKEYLRFFENINCNDPESKAVQRFCMAFDLYYSEKVYIAAKNDMVNKLKKSTSAKDFSIISFYLKQTKLCQYRDKTYKDTIKEESANAAANKGSKKEQSGSILKSDDCSAASSIKRSEKFFGSGFSDADYLYLQEQYDDWVSRHECKTKSQEENFKQICFIQLALLKANRTGEDTKDLNATYLKLTEAGRLQPKQNIGDVLSDVQSWGTIVEKIETTRPIPEAEEEFKDVDRIGLYEDVFLRGHQAEMLGINKGSAHKRYIEYLKQYTVNKPKYEFEDDGDTEVLFDKIFSDKFNGE